MNRTFMMALLLPTLGSASGCKLFIGANAEPEKSFSASKREAQTTPGAYLNEEELAGFGAPAFSAVSYGAACASHMGFIPAFSCEEGNEIAPEVFEENPHGAKSRMINLTAHVPIGIALSRVNEERKKVALRLEAVTLGRDEREALITLAQSLDDRHQVLLSERQKNPDGFVDDVALWEEEKRNCTNPNNFGNCRPNTRIGVLSSFDRRGSPIPDVTVSFACRAHPGKHAGTVTYDAALIQTNRKTGDTCWFQMFGSTDGKRIPSPFSPAMLEEVRKPLWSQPEITAARRFWIEPIVYSSLEFMACARCHEAHPFIINSHINGLRSGGIYQKPLLPVESNRAQVPYRHLAPGVIPITGNHPSWQGHLHVRALPAIKDISDGRAGCTSCHRIGSGYGCSTLMKMVDWNDTQFEPHAGFKARKTFTTALAAQESCCAAVKGKTEPGLYSTRLPGVTGPSETLTCELLPIPATLNELKSQSTKNKGQKE